MTLYIIRHGETEYNRQGIVQGSGVDGDLNQMGRKQAHFFYRYYQHIHFDYIVTSVLKRTHQTVEPFLLRGSHKDWIKTADLNEISWGIHEGQKGSAEQHENYKRMMSDWGSEVYDSRIEGGESAAELKVRVQNALDSLRQPQFKGKNILLCTHGRTLLCLLTILKDIPLSKMHIFGHQNTCLYKVHLVDDEFIFELENNTAHLGELGIKN